MANQNPIGSATGTLAEGLSVEIISKLTSLTHSEIQALV